MCAQISEIFMRMELINNVCSQSRKNTNSGIGLVQCENFKARSWL